MKCKLAETTHKVWPGRTFFTTSIDGEMLPTAVYVPPSHIDASRILNVLLFFHGWYVGSKEDLINTDDTRLCETVINSGKDLVLVAPFLGSKSKRDDGKTLQTGLFGKAGYGQRFLKAILDALVAPSISPFLASRIASAGAASRTIRGVDAVSAAGPVVPTPFGIKNLIVACHSGGGVAMRNVVQTLGQFESNLRESIGLDCLYTNGDANFWFDRANRSGTPPAFFFFGPSTVPESIKLYLMAKGEADASGNQRNPVGPPLGNLRVRPAYVSQVMYGGVTTNVSSYIDRTMDDVIAKSPSPAAPTGGAAPNNFVDQAIENFTNGYIFPDFFDVKVKDYDPMGGTHYFIARAFLRERLKNVSLA